MENSRACTQYAQQSLITASPQEILLMLLNAEVKNIKIAIIRIEEGNIQEAHNRLMTAKEIINELILSLNDSFAVSKQLMPIYLFIKSELVEANIKKDAQRLRDLIPVVTELRDTWQEAAKLAALR
jgi:flagellar protein FliS